MSAFGYHWQCSPTTIWMVLVFGVILLYHFGVKPWALRSGLREYPVRVIYLVITLPLLGILYFFLFGITLFERPY